MKEDYDDIVFMRGEPGYADNLDRFIGLLSPDDWKDYEFEEYSYSEIIPSVSFITRNGTPIGILSLGIGPNNNERDHDINVNLVYILASERGQGHMKHVYDYIDDMTCEYLSENARYRSKLNIKMDCISEGGVKFKDTVLSRLSGKLKDYGVIPVDKTTVSITPQDKKPSASPSVSFAF